MKLLDWMRSHDLDDDALAARINRKLPRLQPRITGHAVKKWKYGERLAPADKIVIIEEITRGQVTLRDLAEV